MTGALFAGGAIFCASFLFATHTPRRSLEPNTFVIAESGLPVSLDPLDADYSTNLHASQMIHRTLLDVGLDNTLHSTVLSHFEYDPRSAEIRLVVKDGQTFSDGSLIRPEDVEFSILRMAAKRPGFPVLKHIQGMSTWANLEHPLKHPLSGVRRQGNRISIKLIQDVSKPLYRFALPLFGIVKKDCVALDSNKLAKNCPISGHYKIRETLKNSISFERVRAQDYTIPKEITLKYLESAASTSDFKKMENGSFVVLLKDYDMFSESKLSSQAEFQRIEQPSSRFSAFLLNPLHKAFSRQDCRWFFAQRLRKNLAALGVYGSPEASLFSRILPGYSTKDDLEDNGPNLTSEQEKSCHEVLRSTPLRWTPSPGNKHESFFSALRQTSEQLAIPLEVGAPQSPKDLYSAFAAGKVDILLGGSGFWAFDPVGDVQMLFTKGLHKPLAHVSSDSGLQKLLANLEFEMEPLVRLKQINQYVFDQALFNVYSHSKRVYLIKGPGVVEDIPIAITPPAPWQVFRVEEN